MGGFDPVIPNTGRQELELKSAQDRQDDPTTESVQAFVVENGTARLRIVQTAEAGGSEIRVLSGIEPGEKVAALNLDQLYDGAPVETVGR